MKAFLLLAAMLAALSSQAAHATQLVSLERYTNANGEVSEETHSGLLEDGFSEPAALCYQGRISGVCRLVSLAADASTEEYSSGGHGYFEVESCEVQGDEVNLSYQQRTDYGDSAVSLVIKSCDAVDWF